MAAPAPFAPTLAALFGLPGQVAVVTAAGRGIGRATALWLARAGAKVAVSDLDAAAAESTAQAIADEGGQALAQTCDVALDDDLQRLVDRVQAQWGGIDSLVCNAGISPHVGPLAAASDAHYARTMDVNLRSAWKLCSLVTPGMVQRGAGAVVFTASIAALRGSSVVGLYGVSKAGLVALARNLAVELGPLHVRVNAVLPGMVQTDFVRPVLANPETAARRRAATPLRRFGQADEVAATVLYLLSPAGAFTTGQGIVVDGGTLITDGS